VQIDPIISQIQPFENVKIYKEMYDLPDSCQAMTALSVTRILKRELNKNRKQYSEKIQFSSLSVF